MAVALAGAHGDTGYAIGGLIGLIIGLILMKGEWIVSFVYGPEQGKEDSN